MNLEDYLEWKGIPIAAIARRVGISKYTMASIVHGKSLPKLEVAMEIESFTEGKVKVKDMYDYYKNQERLRDIPHEH